MPVNFGNLDNNTNYKVGKWLLNLTYVKVADIDVRIIEFEMPFFSLKLSSGIQHVST